MDSKKSQQNNPFQPTPPSPKTPWSNPSPSSETPPQNQNPSPSPSPSEPISTEPPNGEFIGKILIAGETPPEPAPAPVQNPGLLTPDQFWDAFRAAFNVAGQLTRMESVPIDESDQGARVACDALYDTALELPWLKFLVKPENVYVKRALFIFAFAGPKALAIRMELQARRTARAAKSETKGDRQTVPSQPVADPGNDHDPLAAFPKDAA